MTSTTANQTWGVNEQTEEPPTRHAEWSRNWQSRWSYADGRRITQSGHMLVAGDSRITADLRRRWARREGFEPPNLLIRTRRLLSDRDQFGPCWPFLRSRPCPRWLGWTTNLAQPPSSPCPLRRRGPAVGTNRGGRWGQRRSRPAHRARGQRADCAVHDTADSSVNASSSRRCTAPRRPVADSFKSECSSTWNRLRVARFGKSRHHAWRPSAWSR